MRRGGFKPVRGGNAQCISAGKLQELRGENPICYHNSFSCLPEYASWKDKYTFQKVCGPGSLSVVPLKAASLCWLTSVEHRSWLVAAEPDRGLFQGAPQHSKKRKCYKCLLERDMIVCIRWTGLNSCSSVVISWDKAPTEASVRFFSHDDWLCTCVLWTLILWLLCIFSMHTVLFSCLSNLKQFWLEPGWLPYSCVWEEGGWCEPRLGKADLRPCCSTDFSTASYLGSKTQLSVCTAAITAGFNFIVKIYSVCSWVLWLYLTEQHKYTPKSGLYMCLFLSAGLQLWK